MPVQARIPPQYLVPYVPVQARIPAQYLAPSCPDPDALGCHGVSHNTDIPCFIFLPDIKGREETQHTQNVYRVIHTNRICLSVRAKST